MKKFILCLLTIALFSACSDAPKAPAAPPTPTAAEAPAAPPVAATPTPPVVPAPATVAQTTCYALRFKKDLDAIQLTINGDDVTGLYAVEPHEKDGAHGSIKGKKTGDQILGIFLYMIEGSVQSEEVMFKISGDKLLKANGELVDKGGVLMLKDKAKVKWEETFTTSDCAKVSKAMDNAKDMVAAIEKLKK